MLFVLTARSKRLDIFLDIIIKMTQVRVCEREKYRERVK